MSYLTTHNLTLASGTMLLAIGLSGCGSEARQPQPVIQPVQVQTPVVAKPTSTRPDAVGPQEAYAEAMRKLTKDGDRQAYGKALDDYMESHRQEIRLRASLVEAEKKHRAAGDKVPAPQEVPGYADLQLAIETKASCRSQIELLTQMNHLTPVGWDLTDAEALAAKGRPSRSSATLFRAAHDQVDADIAEGK